MLECTEMLDEMDLPGEEIVVGLSKGLEKLSEAAFTKQLWQRVEYFLDLRDEELKRESDKARDMVASRVAAYKGDNGEESAPVTQTQAQPAKADPPPPKESKTVHDLLKEVMR